jgi:5-formyltetrahydrofolate cyclo-ligase
MSAAEFRKLYAARRDALSPEARAQKSVEIWKRLAALPVFQAASQALFYVSFRSEVETELMRGMARALGMRVAAPRSETHSKDMAFYELEAEEKLESGSFGLLQPAKPCPLADLSQRSVVLVPGLVFDPGGNRLGWGGGYYDRFLAGKGRALPSIGLAFEAQIAEKVPVQDHDIPVAWIVTEARVLNCSSA